MDNWQLQQRQLLPLEVKIELTKQKIIEWYEHWEGYVYVAFSGGKDSTVLLDIVRTIYPNVSAVFCDTGLEYPEIREFVKTIDNVIWLKPKMNFKDAIEKYGYPIISKEQSGYIHDYRNAKPNSHKVRDTRLNGNKWGRGISKKWKYLLDAPFKISDKCCEVMKKRPFKTFEKENKLYPILGNMAVESSIRAIQYQKNGCNAFNVVRKMSNPLGFWMEQDILNYIVTHNIPYASVYGEIINISGKFETTGQRRTGCMFCMFGVHMDKEPNRFQRMKMTHPKMYDYCMREPQILNTGTFDENGIFVYDIIPGSGLGLAKVLDFIGVKY